MDEFFNELYAISSQLALPDSTSF